MNIEYVNSNNVFRHDRPAGQGLVMAMLRDLARGAVSPNICFLDLDHYYGSFRETGIDPQSCFAEACQEFGHEVGWLLVVTDKGCKTVLIQAGEPGGDLGDAKMASALAALASQLSGHLTHGEDDDSPSREYPIFVMPRYPYVRSDGPHVARYGRYLTSLWRGDQTISNSASQQTTDGEPIALRPEPQTLEEEELR